VKVQTRSANSILLCCTVGHAIWRLLLETSSPAGVRLDSTYSSRTRVFNEIQKPQAEAIVPQTTNVTADLISHNDILRTPVAYESLADIRTMIEQGIAFILLINIVLKSWLMLRKRLSLTVPLSSTRKSYCSSKTTRKQLDRQSGQQ
jgi:hypothetical protein